MSVVPHLPKRDPVDLKPLRTHLFTFLGVPCHDWLRKRELPDPMRACTENKVSEPSETRSARLLRGLFMSSRNAAWKGFTC